MKQTHRDKYQITVEFENDLESLVLVLPNGARVDVQPDYHYKGIQLRGVPNIGLGTIKIMPIAGNCLRVLVDEEVRPLSGLVKGGSK